MDAKAWLKAWNRAEKALSDIKRKELQEFDYQKHWKVLDEMLQWVCENTPMRKTTGLIEWQKFILKNKHNIKVL